MDAPKLTPDEIAALQFNDFPPDVFLALRIECEVELARLGLAWKHERVRAFLGQCFPPRATLDCADEATLRALLAKLKRL